MMTCDGTQHDAAAAPASRTMPFTRPAVAYLSAMGQ